MASESSTEGMNSIAKEHSCQKGFPKSWDWRDLPAFLVSWQKFQINSPSKAEKNSCQSTWIVSPIFFLQFFHCFWDFRILVARYNKLEMFCSNPGKKCPKT